MSNTQGATPPPAGEGNKAGGTSMVVVGCKLPNGLILELGKIGDEDYRSVRLKGANDAVAIGGYGMTDVSKDFWEAWLKKNKRLEFVRKGFVFSHNDHDSARDYAKERKDEKTGLEALNPGKDERIKGVKDEAGRPLVEVDMDHFQNAKRNVADATQRLAR